MTPEGHVIGFDQLDIRFNRPDIVLASLSPQETSLIGSYYQAYLKRIRDLHIDTTQFTENFNLPSLTIMNRDKIDFKQKGQILLLHLRASDSIHSLAWLNAWVNEVPIYGSKGINISAARKHFQDTSLNVALSEGINSIEVEVMNEVGGTSYRYPLFVSYKSPTPIKEKIYFIGIGSSKFSTPGHDLNWCINDIKSLAEAFKRKYGNLAVVDTLFDGHVTVDNIQRLKRTLQRSGINDKVIIAFSGHGLYSKKFQYFLSTYNMDFDNPEKGGLPYEQLYDLLDGIPARKKLMFIDACNSGELDTAILKAYGTLKSALQIEGVKGAIVSNVDTGRVGMQQLYELTQELFVDVRKTAGANVIAASSALEFAKEEDSLRNGVFTYCILEAFRENKTLTVNQLKQIVETRVPQITKGLQKPTARNQTIDANWSIW
jgi:hypothetical protein